VIDGNTRVYALLGDPVAHSLSPAMQNAAFRALGLRAVYVALRCDSSDVAHLIRALTRAGGGGNVTIPHTEAAALAVDRRFGEAEEVGACNVFWGEDGAVVGGNTDIEGLMRALEPAAPRECGMVVNATPLGLRSDDPLPLDPGLAPQAAVAFDMVYRTGETPWVRAMRAAGRRAADGRGMLVAQGAGALERWFPGVAAPTEIMRAAVDAALR